MPIEGGEATGVNFFYTDYRDHDVLVSSFGISGSNTGLTIGARISGISRFKTDGTLNTVSLTISIGSPTNPGARCGAQVFFGPGQDYDIPTDGILVVQTTVGYTGTAFALNGSASTVPAPQGLGGSTVAAYFSPGGASLTDSYTGTIYIYAGEADEQPDDGGSLVTPPENLILESIDDVNGSDEISATFSFDYTKMVGELSAISTYQFYIVAGPNDDPFSGQNEQYLLNGACSDMEGSDVSDPLGLHHYEFNITTGVYSHTKPNLTVVQCSGALQNHLASKGPWRVYLTGPGATYSPSSLGIILPESADDWEGPVQLSLAVGMPEVSGIYTIVPDKTDDTLYDRVTGSGATTDNKIPNPTAKLGFVP